MTTAIKREVNLMQLVAVATPLLLTMIGGWITTQNEITKIKTEVENIKQQRSADKQELRDEMKEIKTDIKEIKHLLLQQAMNNGKDK
jgi:septal ring factor EnvC (AmiA/AmiB activator)